MILEFAFLVILLTIMIYSGVRLIGVFANGGQTDTSDWLDSLDRVEQGSTLHRRMQTLQLNMEPWLFIAGLVTLAIMVFFLFLELFPGRWEMAGLAGAAMLVFALFLVRDLARRRSDVFETRLTHAIDLMLTAQRGGHVPLAALSAAATASKAPVKPELDYLVRQLQLGSPVEEATRRMLRLYPCEGVRLFVQVLRISWESGTDFGELLRSVNRIIRDRIKFRLKISGQLAGVRYSTVFVALLPYLVIPFFLWKYPEWVRLLTGHENGPTFLLAAMLAQVAGFFWVRHILRVGR